MRYWLVFGSLVLAAVWWLPSRSPNVLLISVGGLRADALSSPYVAPHLNTLAASGTLFTQAVTTAPWTRAALSSLLTGRTPLVHRVRSPNDRLEALPTLPESFQRAGYRTAAIVSDFDVDEVFGTSRGFDLYDDHFNSPIVGDVPAPLHLPSLYFGNPDQDRSFRVAKLAQDSRRPDPHTTDAALGYLRRVGKQRFFLWVHYFGAERRWPKETSTAELLLQYPDAVRELDEQVGRLLAGLTELGLHDDTVVVLIGDHGQSLLEHGTMGTGQVLYETSVRVPLIVSWWGRLPYGRKVDVPVSILDVAPTLVALAGLPDAPHQDGTSLGQLLDGPPVPSESALYLETYIPATVGASRPVELPDGSTVHVGTVRRSLRTGHWKLIRSEPHGLIDSGSPASVADAMRRAATVEELYDLKRDPGETTNLIVPETQRADALRVQLDHQLRAYGSGVGDE